MLLKKSLIKIIKIFGIGFTFLYPFAVFFALQRHITIRFFALLLVITAGVTFVRNKNIWIFVCVLLFGIGLIVFKDTIFLKLYPVLMNISVCLMFALSLRDTPLIEKFAKQFGYKLDEKQQKYTKQATHAWALFMFCLAVISFVTVFLSDEIWVRFNRLISYVLIGTMMFIEFIIRKNFEYQNT